jgi:chromate reductase, NAD(P)H dehydrogenase (quinone)
MKIVGVAGSLRRDSYNARLLEAAAELLPEGVEFERFDGLKAVPPYDEDDDVDPPAEAVAHLRETFAGADGVLFTTPEYNSSIPGVLKNAIDWASRPLMTNPLRFKPVAVAGASTGAFGAVWAQEELRKVLGALGARVVEGSVPVGHAPTRFDESGKLVDEEIRAQLAELGAKLVGAIEEREAAAAPAAAPAA